ncbi:hypothetical protein ACO1O0_006420 [Amphichorda felina]
MEDIDSNNNSGDFDSPSLLRNLTWSSGNHFASPALGDEEILPNYSSSAGFTQALSGQQTSASAAQIPRFLPSEPPAFGFPEPSFEFLFGLSEPIEFSSGFFSDPVPSGIPHPNLSTLGDQNAPLDLGTGVNWDGASPMAGWAQDSTQFITVPSHLFGLEASDGFAPRFVNPSPPWPPGAPHGSDPKPSSGLAVPPCRSPTREPQEAKKRICVLDSCDACKRVHVKCHREGSGPCRRCLRRGTECERSKADGRTTANQMEVLQGMRRGFERSRRFCISVALSICREVREDRVHVPRQATRLVVEDLRKLMREGKDKVLEQLAERPEVALTGGPGTSGATTSPAPELVWWPVPRSLQRLREYRREYAAAGERYTVGLCKALSHLALGCCGKHYLSLEAKVRAQDWEGLMEWGSRRPDDAEAGMDIGVISVRN